MLLLLIFLWVSPVQESLRYTIFWVNAKHIGLLIHRRDFSTDTLSKKMKWCTGGFERLTCICNICIYGPVRFYCTYRQDNENKQDVSLAIESVTNPSTEVHNLVYFLLSFSHLTV